MSKYFTPLAEEIGRKYNLPPEAVWPDALRRIASERRLGRVSAEMNDYADRLEEGLRSLGPQPNRPRQRDEAGRAMARRATAGIPGFPSRYSTPLAEEIGRTYNLAPEQVYPKALRSLASHWRPGGVDLSAGLNAYADLLEEGLRDLGLPLGRPRQRDEAGRDMARRAMAGNPGTAALLGELERGWERSDGGDAREAAMLARQQQVVARGERASRQVPDQRQVVPAESAGTGARRPRRRSRGQAFGTTRSA